MSKRKRQLTEGDLMRWAGETKSLIRRRRGTINTNRSACGRLLAAMKPARLAELFAELDIDYVEIIREIYRLSREGQSSDGVRLSALRELRGIYVMVAACHPDVAAEIEPEDDGADRPESPFVTFARKSGRWPIAAP